MSKIFCGILIYLSSSFCLNAHGTKFNYLVKGVISGVSSKWIYLKPGYGADYGTPDSVFSRSGEFSFRGTSSETRLVNLAIEGVRFSCGFIMEKGTIVITGDINDMNNAIVKGGTENIAYAEYKALSRQLNGRNQDILTKMTEAKRANDTAAFNSHTAEWNKMGAIFEKTYEDFIKKNLKTFAALNACRNHTFGVPELAFRYLSFIHPSLRSHSVYIEVKRRAEIETRIGFDKSAPDFTQTTHHGTPFSLSSLKGKYVLLDFWASWCVPCRKESPNLVKAYQQFHEKGLEIVSISVDESKEKWLKAINDDGYKWINVSDLKGFKNIAAELYGVSAIPKNFLLDKEGKIVAMNLLGDALIKKLELLVK